MHSSDVALAAAVYATMRNLSKSEKLIEAAGRTLGRTLEIKQLDVCCEESIKACVDSLPERRVDILSKPASFSTNGSKDTELLKKSAPWQSDTFDQKSCSCCFPVTVSNAGMGMIGPIECQSIDEMKTVMDTNFFGFVRLLKEILPDMKKRKKGHIVVISSVMGIQGEHHEHCSVTLLCYI